LFYHVNFIVHHSDKRLIFLAQKAHDDNSDSIVQRGRPVPSFRSVVQMEKKKPFRNRLDRSDRKKFDEEMLD